MAETEEIRAQLPASLIRELDEIAIRSDTTRLELIGAILAGFVRRYREKRGKGGEKRRYPRRKINVAGRLYVDGNTFNGEEPFEGDIEDISMDGIRFVYDTSGMDIDVDRIIPKEFVVEFKSPRDRRSLNLHFEAKRIVKTGQKLIIGARLQPKREVDYNDFVDFLWMLEENG